MTEDLETGSDSGFDTSESTDAVDLDASDTDLSSDADNIDIPDEVPEDSSDDYSEEGGSDYADDFFEDDDELAEDDDFSGDDGDYPDESSELLEDVSEESAETEESPEDTDELPEDTEEISEDPEELSDNMDDLPEDTDEPTESTDETVEELQELSEDTEEPIEEVPEQPEELDEQPEGLNEQPEELDEQPEELTEEPEKMTEEPEKVTEELEEFNKQPEGLTEEPEELDEQPEESHGRLEEGQDEIFYVRDPERNEDMDVETPAEATEQSEELTEQQEAPTEEPEEITEQPEELTEESEGLTEQSEELTEQAEENEASDASFETYQYEKAPETLDAKDPERTGEFGSAENEYRDRWEKFGEEFSDGESDTEKWESLTDESTDSESEVEETPTDTAAQFDEQLDKVMNSDLPTEKKREILENLRDEIQRQKDAQSPEYDDTEDGGAPIRVLKRGGNGTGTSHHDYEQELADLDEGIGNWNDMQNGFADDLNRDYEQIMNNPDLSDRERANLLAQNEARRSAFAQQYETERAELQSERDRLLDKLNRANAAQNASQPAPANDGEGFPKSVPTQTDAPVSSSLKQYEMPESSRMVDPDNIDMSDALGMDDPNFWNHHGRSKEDYMDLASKLPTVHDRLERGESLEDLLKDPDVGATANQYYNPEHMIKLAENAERMPEYTGDGRHRIAAAKELGYRFPARFEHNGNH